MCLTNSSGQLATGRFDGRKAQKFGYRNKELISPERGLRSSDSFFVSSLAAMPWKVSTHLELTKRKESKGERKVSITGRPYLL